MSSTDIKPAPRPSLGPAKGRQRDLYCCALCESPITTSDQAIIRAGNHYHDRTNPDGMRFLLACFSTAPGCEVDADSHSEHSWFEDYRWMVARCGRCAVQLGWLFRGKDEFFGLILDRLILREGDAAPD